MSSDHDASLTRGYLAALGAAAMLSTTAVFIRYLTETYHLPALVLAFWRDVFAVATLLPVLAIARPALLRVTRRDRRYLMSYGVMLAAFNAMWTLSVAFNGAAVATVLAYCSAAFTALLGWWLLKEKLDWGKIVAVVLSLSGCVLVANALDPVAWRANPVGILTGILSGLTYAGYSLMGRSASQRGLSPWTTLLYTFGFAAVVLLFINLLPGRVMVGGAVEARDLVWLGRAWAGWGVLFVLAAGPTLAGFGLYNVSLSYLPSSVVNLIVTLEPAFTVVTAYLFLGERLTLIQAAGGLIIIGGVAVLRITRERRTTTGPKTLGADPGVAAITTSKAVKAASAERDKAKRILTSLFGQPVTPFRTFDQQDSGCVAWGVTVNGERLLIKYADHDSLDGRGCRAVDALRNAATFHTRVAHPNIVPVSRQVTLDEGLALIFPWVDGEVLASPSWPDRRTNPDSPYSRFVRLPTQRKLAALDAIIDAHRAVTAAGYIAVDFYLGCVLYDFDRDRVWLIDFDHYHPGPYVLTTDRQLGSSSLMPPKEFQRGARIDVRATIYTIGRMALELLGDQAPVSQAWQASRATYDVMARATATDPNQRYGSYAAFYDSWCASRRAGMNGAHCR